MRYNGAFLFCLLAGALIYGQGWAQESVAQSFRALDDSLTLHEPVLVEFSLLNGLQDTVQADLGFNRKRNFEFAITAPDGARISAPPVDEGGLGQIGQISLQAGETYSQVLILNEWYDFDVPGNYEVEAQFTGSIHTEGNAEVQAGGPQKIRLTILPRDPRQLAEVCESLSQEAVQASSYVEARDAALALSFIQDPIAVPYLERVLREAKLMRVQAANGLARIATPGAIEILRASLNTGDSELEAIARSALGTIDRKTNDPTTRVLPID
jgi:hypothetical protein